MSLMQLRTGDVWEIDGERHYLDRILEGGFLVLRAFETGQPYQRLLRLARRYVREHG